MSHTEQ